jgi:flagellar basal-body rod protein FlgG
LRESRQLNDQNPIEFRVRENGDVFVNENLVGRMTLLQVENPQTLQRESNSLFRASAETMMDGVPEGAISVRQGYVEGSNVNIINEMVQMIQLQRNFEMGQKVISTNDSTMDRSIDLARIM